MGKIVELDGYKTESRHAAKTTLSNLMLNSRPLVTPYLVGSSESVTVIATFSIVECKSVYS